MIKQVIDFKYLDKGKDELNNCRHSHGESYEILLVRSGNGTIMVRDKLFSIIPGAIYFINGTDIHCSAPDIPEEYHRGKIIIAGELIDKIATIAECSELLTELFHINGGTCVMPDECTATYIDSEFAIINRALSEETPYSNITVVSAIFNILSAAHSNSETFTPAVDNRISEALNYINDNLKRNISLEEICAHIHVSKYYLCHMFKKTVGMTVFEYILTRRLSIARKYLRSTDFSVSKVSELTGFSSFSYFSKMFRKYEGVTPSQFKNNGK